MNSSSFIFIVLCCYAATLNRLGNIALSYLYYEKYNYARVCRVIVVDSSPTARNNVYDTTR